MNTISTIAAVIASLLISNVAHADQSKQSTMNQSGTYEATMKFYLHPAHGFPGVAEKSAKAKPVVVAKKGKARSLLSQAKPSPRS